MYDDFNSIFYHFQMSTSCSFVLPDGNRGLLSTNDDVIFNLEVNGCHRRFFGLYRAFNYLSFNFPGIQFLTFSSPESSKLIPFNEPALLSFGNLRWNSLRSVVTTNDIVPGYNQIVLLLMSADCDDVADEAAYSHVIGAGKISFSLRTNLIHPVRFCQDDSISFAAQAADDALNDVILSCRETRSVKTGSGWKEVLKSGVVGWLMEHKFNKALSESIFQQNSPERLLF